MQEKRLARWFGVLTLIVVAVVNLILPASAASSQEDKGKNGLVLKFDVAEDMTRFVFDKNVVHEDGMPKHGSSFITQGYIYQYGTLKNGQDGVNKDGTPKYPEKVLGEWTCRGYFVGKGAHTTTGPMVITTQIYNFGTQLGTDMLVSEGYELADIGIAIQRAITGGTGKYNSASGEATQTFLGFNATEGVSLRYELKLKK